MFYCESVETLEQFVQRGCGTLEVFKVRLNVALGNLSSAICACPWQGRWTSWPLKVPRNLKCFTILWSFEETPWSVNVFLNQSHCLSILGTVKLLQIYLMMLNYVTLFLLFLFRWFSYSYYYPFRYRGLSGWFYRQFLKSIDKDSIKYGQLPFLNIVLKINMRQVNK